MYGMVGYTHTVTVLLLLLLLLLGGLKSRGLTTT
jgi:hypothetical protein